MAVSAKKFNENLSSLNASIDTLKGPLKTVAFHPQKDQSVLAQIVRDLKGMEHVLESPSRISSTLKTIDQTLGGLKNTLEGVSGLKEMKKVAEKMAKNIDSFQKKIDPATEKASDFELKVADSYKQISSFRAALENLYSVLDGFQKGLVSYGKVIAATEECVAAAPDEETKKEMSGQLASVTKDSDKAVSEVSAVLNTFLTSAEGLRDHIQKEINPLIEPIGSLDDLSADFEDNLDALIAPMDELRNLLNSGFSHTFKYPAPTWSNPTRTKTRTISISVDTIMEGAEKVEATIEEALSKTVWEALKMVGLEKNIKTMMKKGESTVNGLLKKTDLEFKFSLAGLDKMGANLNKLEAKIAELPAAFGGIDLTAPEAAINGFASIPPLMETLNSDCKKAKKRK
ncbi:MAG: hypothetical protein H6581_07145 [Bacteroidia bacterium]|nr:hypothetical protein [Bacteroidia bacterium]